MARKDIRTSQEAVTCDVCGRTLLRGERCDVYLAASASRQVCDLCRGRAAQVGWIRADADHVSARPRQRPQRRGVISRLRPWRERASLPTLDASEHDAGYLVDGLHVGADGFVTEPPARLEAPDRAPAPARAGRGPLARVARGSLARATSGGPLTREAAQERGERHVHAVPTNAEMKIARALELFNISEHPRAVAGISRSLGPALVCARPAEGEPSVVVIVVAWELSWYRYEVDLADAGNAVRLIEQGAELDELANDEREPNAAADELGRLVQLASVVPEG